MTLQELSEKIIEAWAPIAERIEKLAAALRKAVSEAQKKIDEHKRLLRRPPKWDEKANSPALFVDKFRVYHCRNNC